MLHPLYLYAIFKTTMLPLRRSVERLAPLTTTCIARLIKILINSCMPRSALLRSRTQCSALLPHAVLDCQPHQMRRMAAHKHHRAAASGELHMATSLHSSSSKEMFVLKLYVANVCFKCFRGILQVFHTDVAKVDQDIAHVAMVVHVCCKLLLSMFHLIF